MREGKNYQHKVNIEMFYVVNNPCKKFVCLIFAIKLNNQTILPSKLLQITVFYLLYNYSLVVVGN